MSGRSLLSYGLSGDAEESLAHIFPAQPFLESTFHQPVLETERIHGSCHRFPIDRLFPRQTLGTVHWLCKYWGITRSPGWTTDPKKVKVGLIKFLILFSSSTPRPLPSTSPGGQLSWSTRDKNELSECNGAGAGLGVMVVSVGEVEKVFSRGAILLQPSPYALFS